MTGELGRGAMTYDFVSSRMVVDSEPQCMSERAGGLGVQRGGGKRNGDSPS